MATCETFKNGGFSHSCLLLQSAAKLGQIWYTPKSCPTFGTALVVRLQQENNQEALKMKGFAVHNGYMGYVEGRYLLFATESDYREFFED